MGQLSTTLPPTLLILIGGHLATAPRPQKEAAAARDAGFRVIMRGNWWSDRLAKEDLELAQRIGIDFAPVMDLRQRSPKAFAFKLKQRLAREWFLRTGHATARSLGWSGPEMLSEALRVKADLTMAHSEMGLWVADQLLARGFKVGVDFEDWFSEDLMESERRCRPIKLLKHLERRLIKEAHATFATTRVMAEALAIDANCKRTPLPIPNCFPWSEAPQPGIGPRDEREPNAVSFYWYSQTIGPGRGLESLGRALQTLKGNWELHLRGELRGYDAWFRSTFPSSIHSRIHLHPSVSNRELPARTSSHDVGLALEVPHCASRDLTATNKIFEYLRAGLAVVASRTQGQCEVMAACPDAGWLIQPDSHEALAEVLQRCLDSPEKMHHAKHEARNAGASAWAWEGIKPALIDALKKTLSAPPAHAAEHAVPQSTPN